MNTNYRIPTPAIGFHPPVYTCRRVSKPFTLDGNINKDFWADIPYTDDFLDIEGPQMPTPRFRTRAKMQWDDENLYFAALLEGPEIWATLKDRDSVIFVDNDFEIFIDPDSDTQQYIEFEMNALNTVWDLMLTKAYHDQGRPIDDFDIHGMKTAVHIDGNLNCISPDNRSWSVEVVMPLKSLYAVATEKRIPKCGEYYRVNFSRVQWKVDEVDHKYVKRINPATKQPYPEDNWVWAPTGVINIHYPEMWGFVFFADEANASTVFDIPQREKDMYQLRLLYYAEQQYFDDHGTYATKLSDLTVNPLPGIHLEATTNFFEITYQTKDERLSILADGRTFSF